MGLRVFSLGGRGDAVPLAGGGGPRARWRRRDLERRATKLWEKARPRLLVTECSRVSSMEAAIGSNLSLSVPTSRSHGVSTNDGGSRVSVSSDAYPGVKR